MGKEIGSLQATLSHHIFWRRPFFTSLVLYRGFETESLGSRCLNVTQAFFWLEHKMFLSLMKGSRDGRKRENATSLTLGVCIVDAFTVTISSFKVREMRELRSTALLQHKL